MESQNHEAVYLCPMCRVEVADLTISPEGIHGQGSCHNCGQSLLWQ
ncbi:MAG: hypothetical protein ACK5MN_00415 [Lachnospiraceae bacterium]